MRILMGGDTDVGAARVAGLIVDCRLEGTLTRQEPLAVALAMLTDGSAWDLAVFAVSPDAAAFARVDPGLPLVLVADELTAEVSSATHRIGARVCLHGHGAAPLRLAILRAATERTSERARALVFLSVTDVIFDLRVEGDRYRFMQINAAFTRATGLTEEQVVGRLVDEVIPEPSLALALEHYRQAISERRTVRWEEVTEYPTGRKYGEVSVTPVVEADGRCSGLIGTVHDITEARDRDEALRTYADLVRAVDIGLTVWSVDLTLAASNPEAERIAGAPLVRGQTIEQVFPGPRTAEIRALLDQVAGDGAVHARELARTAEDARSFAAKAFALPGGRIGVALEDVTVAADAERVEAGERRALELLASGASLTEVLTVIVRMIEDVAPIGSIASILFLDEEGRHLQAGAAPGLPAAYSQALDGVEIGPSVGSCGTAAFRRAPVITEDLETDPLWEGYRDLARPHGLRSCWSFPIAGNDGRILGTFAIYAREPRRPDDATLALMARVTHVTAIAIGRRQLDDELRALSARIEAVREEERTGIAREIHDELGQALTALKMDIASIGRRLLDPDAIAGKIAEMMGSVDAVIQSVRRISAELRPGILDDLGLAAAIEWQVEEHQRRTAIHCEVAADLGAVRLDRGMITAIFRIFQEALTNVARHAGASRVSVRLAIEDDRVVLEVADDGVGVAEIAPRRGLGLLGMRERARRLGGALELRRGEPRGTVVTASIPVVTER